MGCCLSTAISMSSMPMHKTDEWLRKHFQMSAEPLAGTALTSLSRL